MRTLIADHDPARQKTLFEACSARGLVVECASHGAAALEMALERNPDVVICPIDLPVIDGGRLAEILRGNPRTKGASLIFLVHDDLDAPISMDPRDVSVVAPWHPEDVLHQIDAIIERTTRFGEIRSDSEIEGKLSQISVLDLLQIFQMNRKTGTLRVSRSGGSILGSIWLRAGQVIDASVPLPDGNGLTGEKALYRLLTWREGRFEFLPGDVTSQPRIQKPMQALLLEGMRQKDEWDKLRRELPGDSTRLRLLVQRDEIQSGDHPLTREVVDAVESYRKLGEVVDHTTHPDYQVLCVISDLLSRGHLGVDELDEPPDGGFAADDRGVFAPAQVRRIRESVASQRPRPGSVLKIVVVSPDSGHLQALITALRETADFVVDPLSAREPGRFGAIGHFPLGEGLLLRLIALGSEPVWRPLWDVASWGSLGAIILPRGPFGTDLDATEAVFQHLSSASVPLIQLVQTDEAGSLTPEARAQVEHLGGGGVFVLPPEPAEERLEVLRSLFARFVP